MRKKLTRTGDGVALVLDKPLLDAVGLTEDSEVEVSTDGEVVMVAPIRDAARRRKVQRILNELDDEYGGVFKKLAE